MSSAVPKFQSAGLLAMALKECLREYERTTNLQRDATAYRRKIGLLLGWLLSSYIALMFLAATPWQLIGALTSLVLAAAAVSFNVMHDAAHGAASSRRAINRMLAMSLDLLGGSSYIWHWKHNVVHHTFPNIIGIDSDIELWPFARTSDDQPRYRVHTYQHLYMWVLYGFLPLLWYVADIRFLVTGTISGRQFPRPRGWELGVLIGGKVAYVSWAVVIPMVYYPPVTVMLTWFACLYCLGLILSVTFQLSHCVVGTHLSPRQCGPRPALDADWTVHQIRSTANFARDNRLLTWFVGGLNHQIEHHLFPSLCHIHYARLAPRVQRLCADFGVGYRSHRTITDAVIAHYCWLRDQGSWRTPDPRIRR
jgi:linoleoyl-CoA desaturase